MSLMIRLASRKVCSSTGTMPGSVTGASSATDASFTASDTSQSSSDSAGLQTGRRGGRAAARARATEQAEADAAVAGQADLLASEEQASADIEAALDESLQLTSDVAPSNDLAGARIDGDLDLAASSELPDDSPILAALSAAELAYLLEQCGPHPDPDVPGCDRGLPPAEPQPPEIETAGSQFAPEPAAENPIQAAANAVRDAIASRIPGTGEPDLTLVLLALVVLFVVGVGLRRAGRTSTRTPL